MTASVMLWLLTTLVLMVFTPCRFSKALHCTSLTSLAIISILLQRMIRGMSSVEYYFICRIHSYTELKDDLSVTENTRKMPMADR